MKIEIIVENFKFPQTYNFSNISQIYFTEFPKHFEDILETIIPEMFRIVRWKFHENFENILEERLRNSDELLKRFQKNSKDIKLQKFWKNFIIL